MALPNPIGTKLILDACQKWPHLPSRTIARMLVAENKGVWSGIDACRQGVLYRRNRCARKSQKKCKEPVHSDCPTVQHNPRAYIPKSDEKAFLPYVIETDNRTTMLTMGDIHIPYHSVSALTATLDHGDTINPNVILLNGDTLDFHRLSRFQKDPRARDAKSEIDRCNELLDAIDERFPKARKIFKCGNHDERYDSYIASCAPEIYKLVSELASLDQLLELKNRGWDYVAEKRPIYAGKLTILHGHELPQAMIGPVNAARGLFLRTKASALVSHHHQVSEHSEPDIRNKLITTWSLGCLCELHPMYARFNKWAHGAAAVEFDRSGEFKVHNFRIIDGKLMN
jgi:hypothetical protein